MCAEARLWSLFEGFGFAITKKIRNIVTEYGVLVMRVVA